MLPPSLQYLDWRRCEGDRKSFDKRAVGRSQTDPTYVPANHQNKFANDSMQKLFWYSGQLHEGAKQKLTSACSVSFNNQPTFILI